ncbi:MAG: glycosyltransferase [bacterium]
MEVSILIPAWNEASVIKRNLLSLNRLAYPKDQCEVILIGGGADQTYSIALNYTPYISAFAQYKVIEQNQAGKNHAIMRGLSIAQGKFIVLLDADVIVDKDWLYNMVMPIKKNKNRITISNPFPIKRSLISQFYMINKEFYIEKLTHCGGGGGIAFFNDIPPAMHSVIFDPRYKIGVDYLAVERLKNIGREPYFCKEAKIYTYFPSSFKYFMKGELRWTTAYLIINGISYKTLSKLIIFFLSLLLCIVPLNFFVWAASILCQLGYIIKRIQMVNSVSFKGKRMSSYLSYIFLSYIYLGINLVSNGRYLLGFAHNVFLSQGERKES